MVLKRPLPWNKKYCKLKIVRIKYLFFAFLLVLSGKYIFSQENTENKVADTIRISPNQIIVFKDSALIPLSDTTLVIDRSLEYKIKKNSYQKSKTFYDSLYFKLNNNRLTREVYSLVISDGPEKQKESAVVPVSSENPFEAFEDKTIGNIRFVQVDILEGSVDDTSKMAFSNIGVFFNKTHINTREWVLRNYLLFKSGDKLIPGIIADNERVIRELPGIQDARIIVNPSKSDSNKVDLLVISQDLFSFFPTVNISSINKMDVGFRNVNTLGLGYELSSKLFYDNEFDNKYGVEVNTTYRNILSSFVDGQFLYHSAFETDKLCFEFRRDFVSPQTKWGGALNFGWLHDRYNLHIEDSVYSDIYEDNYQDLWIGRAFQIGGKSSRKNVILSGRYQRVIFTLRPFVEGDSNQMFQNKQMYYAKIGFKKYNFYKTSMVRSFGVTEDMPKGYQGGITLGYLNGEFYNRLYFGLNLGAAKYFPNIGYFSTKFIVGGFFNRNKVSQGILESDIYYYSPILKSNRYSARNFINIKYRGTITDDVNINVNFGDDIPHLKQDYLYGKSTLVLNYEFVLFTPWYFYGFQFAPYAYSNLGFISNYENPLKKPQTYVALGLGTRIRNESLAIKTIIISLVYLPNTLGDQSNWFLDFSAGEPTLIPGMQFEKPEILGEDIIYPY
jgi:hypothetical protein